MKPFKSLVVVNAPLQHVWTAVRDRLPELVAAMDEIDRVVVTERSDLGNGQVKLTNEWYAKLRVPDLLREVLHAEAIGWTDRNIWDETERTCHWTIDPWVLHEQIRCSGNTHYESAIGGRGTRVTFEGTFKLGGGSSGLAAAFATPLGSLIESVVTTLIPKNLRKVVEAAALLHNKIASAN